MSETVNQNKGQHTEQEPASDQESAQIKLKEIGGPKGREPTRYGDWEKNGRCIDF
ncbi:MAG: DUF1674 domain-containing protein [Gammaproteobacteria bacterium]|nr:DUF1674 domain-containing protein [Gammaproteobacteria bacterium]